MSKRDARKALVLPLTPDLRRALRRAARRRDGLAATARRLFRSIDIQDLALPLPTQASPDAQIPMTAPHNAHGPPVLVQLGPDDRARLTTLAARLNLAPQEAFAQALWVACAGGLSE